MSSAKSLCWTPFALGPTKKTKALGQGEPAWNARKNSPTIRMFAFLKSCINFEGPRRFKSSILPNENQYLPCENNGLGMFDFVGPTNRKCKQREIITYTHIHRVSSARALRRERKIRIFICPSSKALQFSASAAQKKLFSISIYSHSSIHTRMVIWWK